MYNSYPACSIEENTKHSGHNLHTRKGIKAGNMECFSLLWGQQVLFWTYNPRLFMYLTSLLFVSQRIQVLDEDFGPGKRPIHKGVNFWRESLWSSR